MTRPVYAGALLAACIAGHPVVKAGFPSNNVTFLSNIPAESFPGSPSRGNDCWGYVSPSGREYALMGMRNGLAVVEITDPSFPAIIASVPHSESNWSDVKTYQNYAYVVNESSGGIDVIDLADVDNGNVIHVQSVTDAGVQTSHNVAIDRESGFLYLCGSNIAGGRLVAFDLSDPANPTYAGEVPLNGGESVHDAQIVTYPSGRQFAFAADGGFGLEIFDVTNKSNMFRVSQTTYPNLGFAHQCWLSDDRRYLYLNDEIDGVNETVVFDVTNLAAPFVASTYTAGGEAIDHNLYLHEGLIYEADYTAGLRIYDATQDPLNPVPIGNFDTFPGSDAAEFNGAWSIYPFFPSGNVLISTKFEGLFVVRPGPAPLVFTYPDGLPALIDPMGETILVQITEQDGEQLVPGTAALHYDAGAGPVDVPMSDVGGGLFEGTFGPTPCGQLVRFYLSAQTVSNITMTDPPNAPSAQHSVPSADETTVAFDDDMEADLGWTRGAPGDDAVAGIWVRVEPNGTIAQPEADHTPDPGEICYVTGQGNPNGQAGDEDVDEGHTTLLSPVFDLAGAEDALVSYWRWYSNDFFLIDNDEGAAPNEDIFVIDISNDGGATWCNLETIGPAGPGTSGGWILAFFNVADHVAPTDQVQVRFVASDINGFSIVEAGVDDFRMEIGVCPAAVPGDVDGDGVVGIVDLLALLAAWGPCGDCSTPRACPADFDGDCEVGIEDFLTLLANWG